MYISLYASSYCIRPLVTWAVSINAVERMEMVRGRGCVTAGGRRMCVGSHALALFSSPIARAVLTAPSRFPAPQRRRRTARLRTRSWLCAATAPAAGRSAFLLRQHSCASCRRKSFRWSPTRSRSCWCMFGPPRCRRGQDRPQRYAAAFEARDRSAAEPRPRMPCNTPFFFFLFSFLVARSPTFSMLWTRPTACCCGRTR